jgi:imidazolonepropionase-like amidohydrolase
VVVRGKIVAVGPAADVRVPRVARIFDGTGKTLVPGLWDSHMHVADDYAGPRGTVAGRYVGA